MITVRVLQPSPVEVCLQRPAPLSAELGEISLFRFPLYDGPYQATPSPEEDIVLETEGKRMTQQVTLLKIPYAEVNNPAGGKTITIGGY